MGIRSGESSSGSSSSDGLAEWVPTLAVAGAAFAAGVLVVQLWSPARSVSKIRRTAVEIFPARYKSSRFEENMGASETGIFFGGCWSFGAHVAMTSEICANGTERCEEALRGLKKKYDMVVNIQGDEPLIDPDIINGVVQALRFDESLPSHMQNSPDANFSTAVTDLSPEDALDPNRVKCVVDRNGYAIYFCRGMVPFNK